MTTGGKEGTAGGSVLLVLVNLVTTDATNGTATGGIAAATETAATTVSRHQAGGVGSGLIPAAEISWQTLYLCRTVSLAVTPATGAVAAAAVAQPVGLSSTTTARLLPFPALRTLRQTARCLGCADAHDMTA